MTVAEVEARVELIAKLRLGQARTLSEYSLFVDVLRLVARSNVSHANAKALCVAALELLA